MGIAVRNLVKNFGSARVVDDVSFEVGQGQLVALLGPSGSGKSTILRIIAGLEVPDSGQVLLTGEDATAVPVNRRGVGFVFQHYALFKHMTVAENIGFGLSVRGETPERIRERVDELLRMVHLPGLAHRYPHELSGGQRQRVALARALAPAPRVLLLDEPFAALDAEVRIELRNWIRRMHDEFGVTSLFVTHDREEAMELADMIVVLRNGRVEQIGSPRTLYEQPANAFVAKFLGPVNVLESRQENGQWVYGPSNAPANAPINSNIPDPPREAGSSSGITRAYVRPHHLELERTPNGTPVLRGTVKRSLPLGGVVRVEVALDDGTQLQVQLTPERAAELSLRVGETVYAGVRQRVYSEDYVI